MARQPASRKYTLVFNNPLEHGYSHEVIRNTINSFSSCQYWCMCDEIGEQGTPHTHLYLHFQNPVMLSTIHTRFYGANHTFANGTAAENRTYIRKKGKWLTTEKHDTNLIDTFEESGDLPDERASKRKESEAVMELVASGASNAEILHEFPGVYTKLPHIDAARQTLLEEQFRTQFRTLHVEYLWGKTGVGKTRGIMERYGYNAVYRVTNYAHPFDGCAGVARTCRYQNDRKYIRSSGCQPQAGHDGATGKKSPSVEC